MLSVLKNIELELTSMYTTFDSVYIFLYFQLARFDFLFHPSE